MMHHTTVKKKGIQLFSTKYWYPFTGCHSLKPQIATSDYSFNKSVLEILALD